MSLPQELFGARQTVSSVTRDSGRDRLYAVLARVLSVIVALVALVVTLPVFLVLLVIIRLDSPGPAIFRQERLGVHASRFRFYKFRTMYIDARERFPELYAYRYESSQLEQLRFKVKDDPRLTRVGAWLRRTSLDELPNLLNVLKGNMNLVGPRPELPEMLQYYRPEQMAKWSVRPGVTGLAQVCGRAFLRFQETIDYDLEYVRRRSMLFDVYILWRTVRQVLLGVGAF